jgi:hypothetical protein
LHYGDTYLAENINLWFIPGTGLTALVVLWAMGVPVLVKEMAAGRQEPDHRKVAVVAPAVGAFLALPWLYALVCVLRKPIP